MTSRRFPLSLLTVAAGAVAFAPVVRVATTPPRPTRSALPASLRGLDDSNMEDLLFRPREGKAVLVDACAPWCGPCQQIEPFVEACAEKYAERLSVVKYDVESGHNTNLKLELLLQGVVVRGLPTLLLYDEGRLLASRSGAITQPELDAWLETSLNTRTGERRSEAGLERREDAEETERAGSGVTHGRKGFVSLASQVDEYALTGSRAPARTGGWICTEGVCRRPLARATGR